MTCLASFATLTSVFLAACAVTTAAQAQTPASAMNGVLVGPNQMTLYVFAFVVIMALFLWLTDKTLEWVIYDLVLGWKH